MDVLLYADVLFVLEDFVMSAAKKRSPVEFQMEYLEKSDNEGNRIPIYSDVRELSPKHRESKSEKIARLRAEIISGNYPIDAEWISRKIIEDFTE